MKRNGHLADELAASGERAQAADSLLQAITAFASAPQLRSATVAELVLEDFHRRPARPEDWSFLALEPVRLEAASRLITLATNRLLCAIYDRSQLWPLAPDGEGWEAYLAHHDDALGLAAARLRPLLEELVFAQLVRESECAPELGHEALQAALEERFEAERVVRASYEAAAEGKRTMLLRFDVLQRHGVLAQHGAALRLARARSSLAERLLPVGHVEQQATAVAGRCSALGLRAELHAHWQFYLPTTLMSANHPWSLLQGPRLFAFVGAALFGELQALAFARAHDSLGPEPAPWLASATRRLGELGAQFGVRASSAVAQGFAQARRLQRVADRDRLAQMLWLRDLDAYTQLAQELDARIQREQIAIDRETFVEPREMCSTTHLHDDHRLVAIESGAMIFWGMPGMELALAPGEMTLVPCGRLHGSTVTSPECVYHQPIIPESWIADRLPEASIGALSLVGREQA